MVKKQQEIDVIHFLAVFYFILQYFLQIQLRFDKAL